MKKFWWLRIRLFASMLVKGKSSFLKIINAVRCYAAYFLRTLRAGKFPVVVFIDISNRCNLFCSACRIDQTRIFDQNPEGDGNPIPVGNMSLETFQSVLLEAKNHVLLAVLYVNGEPLLHKDLFLMLKYAAAQKIATMISTNAMLLDEKNAAALLGSGVDFIKIAVSGFTQATYATYHRGGDVEIVKRNIAGLVTLWKRSSNRPIVLVDYIVFAHNQHEIDLFRNFCDQLGIAMDVRAGISQGHDTVTETNDERLRPRTSLCDWPWKVMTINWDGSVFACCEFTTWSQARALGTYAAGKTKLEEVWNGEAYRGFRNIHLTKGRNAIKRCQGCHYRGLGLQA